MSRSQIFFNPDITDYVSIFDHILNGSPVTITPSKLNIVKKRPPRLHFNEDNKIDHISVSYSLIKKMYHLGEPLELCPYRLYMTELTSEIEEPSTLSQQKGKYFEYKCIGGSANNDIVLELPTHKRTGKKLVDTIRIDNAVLLFQDVIKKLGMMIHSDYVQYKTSRVWMDKNNLIPAYLSVVVGGTIDLISPIDWDVYHYPAAVFDLKLTMDRDSCFPPFCWGDPQKMDLIQGIMYSSLTGLPFFYLIFDYRANNPGWKIIPIKTMATHPNDPVAILREKELDQTIRGVVVRILDMEAKGWPKEPSTINCKNCPVTDCLMRYKTEPT